MPAVVAEPVAEDLAIWRRALTGVTPLGGRTGISLPDVGDEPPVVADAEPALPTARAAARRSPRPAGSAVLDPRGPVDIDRRTWIRLRRGQYPIDARLDLHGLTQTEAHDRLGRFLVLAGGRGHRCVLVITGRGLRRGGALRQMTPRWLDTEPIRSKLLAYAPARQQHGGEGALYVLLRRPAQLPPRG